ncbi:MAG TPA: hypothetical protein VMX13_18015 [Sedimentisphaerales bacterium]|nr:hypothetical protein [Sedimentisphaerales bacterium]
MTKMHLIARIMLTVLGIYLLVQLFDSLHVLLITNMGPQFSRGSTPGLLVFLIYPVIACSIVHYLLFRPDKLVRKMVGTTDDIPDCVDSIWIAAGFRLVLVFCGILITSRNIEFLVNSVAFLVYGPKLIVEMIVYKYIDKTFDMPLYAWLTIVAKLLKGALGIYLLLGAPQYLQWQIDKFDTHAGPVNLGTQTAGA